MIAQLFGVNTRTINEHIQNIFKSQELSKESVIRKFRTTAIDGKSYLTMYYNLDAIISVGYRVNSDKATKFRIWATKQLKEFIIKGFLLDDERLKNPDQPFDYFEELTRRIQDIRTSEKRFYRKITDIYALSVDYDPTSDISIKFFQTVQNKLHWAVSGETAAEIIYHRADSNKRNMGLTNFRGSNPRKDDICIAKNYLSEEELLALNNLVEQYLIFAEGQAMRRVTMKMSDWIKKLHGFLELNDRNILDNAGKVSAKLAKEHAEQEYKKFNKIRVLKKDSAEDEFEKNVKQVESLVSKRKQKNKN